MQIKAQEEIWPLKEPFRISRGSRTEARVVVVTVTDGNHTGRGYGVPWPLKVKLGGDNLDLPRVEAVREVAPNARLLIDANESWSPELYRKIVPALKEFGVELIEQPFLADADEVLESLDHLVPV